VDLPQCNLKILDINQKMIDDAKYSIILPIYDIVPISYNDPMVGDRSGHGSHPDPDAHPAQGATVWLISTHCELSTGVT
jgi:hypothetical protein